MALIGKKSITAFNLSKVECGFVLWGKHCSWEEGKAGIITSATEQRLTVQYYPGIGNVTNHFFIPASEVAAGQWEIRCSRDLAVVEEYRTGTAGGPQEGKEEWYDAGRTDL